MGNIEFAWDRRKARSNLAKHGVSFEEAETVFLDESARLIDDPDHSENEDRFLLLGLQLSGALSDRQPLLPGIRFCDPVDLRQACDSARRRSVLESQMRKEYDFSKSRKNPYAKQLKRQITIRLDTAAVDYFKQMAAELGMPYQNLINLFLRDCASRNVGPLFNGRTMRRSGREVAWDLRGPTRGLTMNP